LPLMAQHSSPFVLWVSFFQFGLVEDESGILLFNIYVFVLELRVLLGF